MNRGAPLAVFVLMWLLAGVENIAWAQADKAVTVTPPPVTKAQTQATVQSLEALLKSLQSKQEAIASVQRQLQEAQEDVTRNALLDNLKSLKKDADNLALQFEKFAVDVDIRPFVEAPKKDFDWQQELGKLLKPIIAEIENATSDARAIGELRSRANDVGEKGALATAAVTNLERLRANATSEELNAELEGYLKLWTRRRDEAINEKTALDLQLENRLAARESLLDTTTGYAQAFFRTRGLNLLFGLGAFLAVFLGIKLFRYLAKRIWPARKEKSLSTRLGTLLAEIFSVIGGLVAMLLVFNMAGDWFLLGIVLIFLLGVGWASVNTLPQHVETIKLMLNIGAVKEDQCLVFDGTPWRVESLGFQARLVNPLLDGGELMIPIKYLVGKHSRPIGMQEEWFPCRAGDWVELADGRFGQVSYQNPNAVQLVESGGSQVVYQTTVFLTLNPRNLSANFRIKGKFGIDYVHQSVCTTEIPTKMRLRLEEALTEVVEKEEILNVNVAFLEAAASSLDYEIELDLRGSAAPRRRPLERAIQRILVDACNENGWEIPFMQVKIHQGG